MFDLNSGYSMYHTEEEFVSQVDKALENGKMSHNENGVVLEKYSWNTVARDHIAFLLRKDK